MNDNHEAIISNQPTSSRMPSSKMEGFYDALGRYTEGRLKDKYHYSMGFYATFLSFARRGWDALKCGLFNDERYPKTNLLLNTACTVNLPVSLCVLIPNGVVFCLEYLDSKRVFCCAVYEVEKNRKWVDVQEFCLYDSSNSAKNENKEK